MSLATVVVATLVIASPNDVEQAKRLYQAGGQAYASGQYLVAIQAFEEAHRLAPRPVVAFSLAQACRLQYFVDGEPRRLERAVQLYRGYLEALSTGGRRDHAAQHLSTLEPILERVRRERVAAGTPDEPDTRSQRAQLIVSSQTEGAMAGLDGGSTRPVPAAFEVDPGAHELRVEALEHEPQTLQTVAVAGRVVAFNVDLRELPGAVVLRAPEGAEVSIDGRLLGASPLLAPAKLSPGRHHIAVTTRGHEPFLRAVEVERGRSTEVEATLEVTTQRVLSHSLFVGSGLLAVGAAIVGGAAVDKENAAQRIGAKGDAGQSWTELEAERHGELVSARDDLKLVAFGLASASLAVAVTGLFSWIFDTPDLPRGAVVAPVVGRDLAGIGFGGRFSID